MRTNSVLGEMLICDIASVGTLSTTFFPVLPNPHHFQDTDFSGTQELLAQDKLQRKNERSRLEIRQILYFVHVHDERRRRRRRGSVTPALTL